MWHKELAADPSHGLGEAQLRWAVGHAADFVVRLTAQGSILAVVSDRSADLLNMPPQALIGLPLHFFIAEDDVANFQELLLEALGGGGPVAFDLTMVRADDSPLWVEGVLQRDAAETDGEGAVLAVLRDVTRWKAENRRLSDLCERDALTGLSSRAGLLAQIAGFARQAERLGRPFTLMALDLDGFKEVNDALGHSIGDALLQRVATRLQQTLGPGEQIFRTGGDEFVILRPPGAGASEADVAFARKLTHSIGRPFHVSGHALRVTVSIGIVRCPDGAAANALDVDALLRDADLAMYDAKRRGKNTHSCFTPAMAEAQLRRQQIAEALFEAASNGEFELHYQPIQDEAERLVGVEALMRWRRPAGEQYSPAEFIPIAEARGLIHMLGAWAIRTACYQAIAWRQQGLSDFYVSVNVSPRQFSDASLVHVVAAALKETGLPPSHLVLEITEGLLMAHAGLAERMLQEFIDMGVRVAVDDFGTGYSSLSYLKRFNLSTLKIDKSFVDDLPGDRDACTIVGAVLGMAKELGLDVVAEGVETEAQFQWLKEKGCRYHQGYLFCRPLPADEILARYRPAKE